MFLFSPVGPLSFYLALVSYFIYCENVGAAGLAIVGVESGEGHSGRALNEVISAVSC